MEKEEYKALYNSEEKHWWFKSMQYLMFDILNKEIKEKTKEMIILDAGCGTGINAKYLEKYGKVIGMDISTDAVDFCKKRGAKILLGSVNSLPFKSNSFSIITCFEVFNHIKVNPITALKEIERVCEPEGTIILRASAYQWMYSTHDRAVHTLKRYTKKEFEEIINTTELKIIKISYICSFLFPLILVKRLIDKITNKEYKKSELDQTNFANNLFFNIMKIETKLSSYINFPFGIQIICILKKIKNS